jgi:hypothetical protein
MFFHKLYGLLLASDEPLPGLPILSDVGVPDLQIRVKLGSAPLSRITSESETVYMSRMIAEDGTPLLQIVLCRGNHVGLLYSDETHFLLDRRGREVLADRPERLTLEDIAPYILGPVLGIVLRLRGIVPLHASAVSISDHAIALVGPAGAGKSTTAAAFAKDGYRVISDDVVTPREEGSRFVIPPGYPRVNLWAESVREIWGNSEALPLISPSWDKRFMPLDLDDKFETRTLPLGGIYVFQKRAPGLSAPRVEQLTGTDAFLALLGNTYMNYLPDVQGRRREFELLARIALQIPIRRVQAADLNMLPKLCATIAADVEELLAPGRIES